MKPEFDFFKVVEYFCMYAGFICIVSLVIINILR